MTFVPNPLVERIIGAAIEVHRHVGPGLLESTYQACVEHELRLRDLAYKRQVAIPVVYKGVPMNCGYRADFVVAASILVEIKSVDQLSGIHDAQTLAYLRLLRLHQALLINFNAVRLVDGLKSFVN
jgi:GxxExxY protein